MREFLTLTREEYDLVVVDTPPISIVSDAIPLLTLVDGVIVVAAVGITTRDTAAELREQLDRLNAHVLGAVANFTKGLVDAYPYYGYGRPADDFAPVPPTHEPNLDPPEEASSESPARSRG